VNHNLLIDKLVRFNISTYLVCWIQQYITNRQFYISMNGVSSATFIQGKGVPQGAILSPLLFNLFIADFPIEPGITTYLYADDIAFFVQGNNPAEVNTTAQNYLNNIQQWATQNALKFNVNKSYVLKCRNNFSPNLFLYNSTIQVHLSIKYLGIIFEH